MSKNTLMLSEFEEVVAKPPTTWPEDQQVAVAALIHRVKTGAVPQGYEETKVAEVIKEAEMTETRKEAEVIAGKGLPIDLSPSMQLFLEEDPKIFALKYLMARKWHVADATKMVITAAQFRLSLKLDTDPLLPTYVPIQGWDLAELKAARGVTEDRALSEQDRRAAANKAIYSGGWHKTDKLGCPLWIERSGACKAREIYLMNQRLSPPGADLSQMADTAREGHIHNGEVGAAILRCENLKRKAKGLPKVFQITVIQDMEGMSLSTLHGETLNLLKEVTKFDKERSGEGMARHYIVNAPAMFTVVWAVVRLWMDERTLKKVTVLKPHEKAKLLQAVDAENLPEFLGGSCTCGGPTLADQKVADAAAAEKKQAPTKLENFCVPTLVSTEAAAEAEAALEGAAGFAETQRIVIKAGKKDTVDFTIESANETILWEYVVAGGAGYDVKFNAHFFSNADGSGTPLSPAGGTAVVLEQQEGGKPNSEKTSNASGSFTSPATGGCKVVFTFDNSYSWMTSKTVHFRVTRAAAAMDALTKD